MPVEAQELALRQIRQLDVDLATGPVGRACSPATAAASLGLRGHDAPERRRRRESSAEQQAVAADPRRNGEQSRRHANLSQNGMMTADARGGRP